MKTLSILLTLSTIAFTFTMTSCKKKGCTDELAINYFSDNKKDDGTCSYSSTKMEGRYKYTWQDTLIDTADVYSFDPSYMGIYSANGFDEGQTEFRFVVEWTGKTMAMPDSLLLPGFGMPFPDTAKSVTGTITDKNSFTVQYVQRIPTWNNPTVWKDTVYNYSFVRI